MNNQPCKINALLPCVAGWVILMVFSNTAAAIDSSVKTNTTTMPNIECLLNWAQTFHSDLFSPAVQEVQFSDPFTYRYYPDTNSYVGVSSEDNHVYYQGPTDLSPKDIGDLSTFLQESGCGTIPYPVIFIHGLASSAETWAAYTNYLINNAKWTFGGIPFYHHDTKMVDISCPSNQNPVIKCTGGAGNFYTLNFSDNQGLPLNIQGGELAVIIRAVLDKNPGATKALLIGHSLGGLAARAYLQGLAQAPDPATPIPYRGDVAKLITIATPHQGSFWAQVCHDDFGISGDNSICDLFNLGIDPHSTAIQELQPDSSALKILNDLTTHPLPSDAIYLSIIGTGQPTLSSLVNYHDGDGIVSNTSQNLMEVTENLPLQQKSIKVDIPFREECGNEIKIPVIGSLGQTHTCETTDKGIGAEVLRNLQ
ncbi:esterase/lipase family protein [Nitrosomonas communis]|uniref:Triacylglycerol esterase/lipase EstA, alpha/beta hydrolase fold n=1 Tax=Nitrosomonas communis TaxID=44574 RepID=A0A1I4Q683_9PROT|nr:hypothetical protein [Nitrosomonas communis]SFM35557.1 Triacylglycerol esterase/lipase EstA, alpha/beta hydrolase fold [Nitrosomonas communis]